jgi:putative ATP-dependent endonuclease of the OLD family
VRLHKLHIRNFRKIRDLTVVFPRGLSVIVGENNAGKTAIVDALRLMLFSSRDFDSLRLNEDDFRRGSDDAPIEIACTFCDLSEDDEVHFHECLVDIGDTTFQARLTARVEFNPVTQRANVKMWGGETEGGSLPTNLFDQLNTVYLKPLRDPASGLRPGKHSQVSRLVNCLTEESKQKEFETIAKDANDKIRELDPVQAATTDIDSQMASIAGSNLTQRTELVFSDPSFHRIIAGLQPEIEGLPFSLNGLGYNNLVYTAATLGTLRRSTQFSFRAILVEEPEAHLHPQLQVLLLRHLAEVAGNTDGHHVQVIASSHSPILASQAPIDSIISVHEAEAGVTTQSVCLIKFTEPMKKKLQRFLDATRAELFFARRILMVEGISEALLMPVLARIAGGCLKDSAVTVLNADGINFNAFLPLFGDEGLTLPVAILTDGDAGEDATPSNAASRLKENENDIPNLRVEFGQITFEHELARSADLLPFMLEAYEALHPLKGPKLKNTVSALDDDDEKARAFLDEFLTSKTSKGRFAQELTGLLEDVESTLDADVVPEYIRNAFSHLGVTGNEGPIEPGGETTGANPVSEAY